MKSLHRFLAILILLTPAWGAAAVPIVHAADTQPDIAASDQLLGFASGGHIVGFRAGEIYLANTTYALSVEFIDGSPVAPESDGVTASRGVSPLGRVTYANLWRGITLMYEPAGGGLIRSAYRIDPGADTRAIHLRYNVPVTLNSDGTLTLAFATGQMTESAPIAWQEIDGQRVSVPIDFLVRDAGAQSREIGFRVGAYDHEHPLFIDPTLTWNTFLGGSDVDYATGMAVDASGNVYVTGYSFAAWQGATAPRRLFSGGATDAFVAKLDASGNLLWNTFLGGSGSLGEGTDIGNGIAVDGSGNIYVVGYSDDTWQGATAPRRSHTGNYDTFVAKLDATGDLIWNTFLGAGSDDYGNGVGVDGSGNLYVTGESNSTWQDAAAPRRLYSGGADAFVARLDTNGDLTWNTFLGGAGNDYGHGIAVYEGGGAVYVSGYSDATWQGSTAPQREYTGGYDAFVAQLDMSGDLAWNTFLGGAGNDTVDGDIAVDGSGNVYVTGSSRATWQGTTAPRRAYSGLADAFVAKVAGDGSLAWNTFLGGAVNDFGHGIAVDGSGDVYVTGASYSTWQGTTPPEPAYSGDYDAFAAQLDPSGDLAWNAFLGAGSEDVGFGVGVDASGDVFVTGHSNTSWQGTTAPQRAYSGNFDAFVAKLAPSSSSADLSNLVLSSGTLNPAFTSATTSYAASVANGVTSITVTPTAADPGATIQVNGATVASGSASGGISLNLGANTIMTVVTAADGVTTKTYTVIVTRDCASAITVSTNSDSGAGSLRQVIADICAGGTITFAGDYTITLASELVIDKELTIDGTGHSVTVSGNHVTRVFNVTANTGTATFNRLTIANGNVTSTDCGSDGPRRCGGGIMVQTGGVTVNVTNSTLSANSAERGGGMANVSGTLNVTNSTLSGNSGTSYAGGIFNVSGPLTVTNSTFSGNSASFGGGIYHNSGTVTVTNSIVVNSSSGGNCSGTIGGSTNLADDASCGSSFSNSSSILLGSLGNYGGSTQTIPLLPGSSAINAGNATYCTIGHDQRGVNYVGGCDIGAFESRGFTLTKSGGDNQHALINTAFAIPLSVSLIETAGPALPGGVITFTPPGSGPSSVLSTGTATTNGSGIASVTAMANGAAGGPYNVTASTAGGTPNVPFALTNDKATATVTLSNLTQEYDGTPKSVTATTNPAGLVVDFTYTGIGATSYGPSATGPTNVGTYNVVATVNDLTYQGSASGILAIQDTTAPVVLSFTRQTPGTSPTNADTLVFRVTFSEGAQNVDSASFTVNGTTTATLTGVAAVNASTYDVTVSGGDLAGFNGTVGLNLAPGQNITDLVGNALPAAEPATNETYLLDNTSAGVTSIVRQNPVSSPTNLASVTFRLTFTDDVQNVDTADFSLATTGTAAGIINSIVVQSASVYDVIITGLAGEGTLDLNLASANDIADLFGNALGSSPAIGTEETYAIDRVVPTVTVSQAAGQSDPTSATPVNFRVVFSESVADFGSADVTVSGTTGATSAAVTETVPMDGTTYNVAVSGMTAGGTVVITIAADAAHDAVSNGNTASVNLDNSVTFALGTTTTLNAAPNPSVPGQVVTCTATVTSASGTPTGTVTFRDGTTILGTGTLNGAGQASFTTGGLSLGTHAMTAEYGGSANFAPSASSAVDLVIRPSSTAQIPTLGEWGVILLMALIAGTAAYLLRRRSAS